jgi:hypothetical protein
MVFKEQQMRFCNSQIGEDILTVIILTNKFEHGK